MKKEIKFNQDQENDLLAVNWGKVKHSVELENVNLVVDFGEEDGDVGIKGFEIFEFNKRLSEGRNKVDKILKKHSHPTSNTNVQDNCKEVEDE